MIDITPRSRHPATGKSVLLYSGGLDSVLFDHLLAPDILLHVPSGARYEPAERDRLARLIDTGGVDPQRLTVLDDVLDLARFERPDGVVPNRNAFLLLFSSIYGETLYLGAVVGDGNLDKDDAFFARMTDLLDHMWQATDWNEARRFEIRSPFRDRTKAGLVRDYLGRGFDPAHLLTSYSCHNGSEPACGVCGPCARKRVALAVNGVAIPDGYFAAEFWEDAEWRGGAAKFLDIPGEGDDFRAFLADVGAPALDSWT